MEETAALKDAIAAVVVRHRSGLSQEGLLEALQEGRGREGKEEILSAVNDLLKEGVLVMMKRPGTDEILLRATTPEERGKFRGLSTEDLLVYQAIKASKDRGIWTQELRSRCNLQQTQLSKCLKTLEGRKLIKGVKSVAARAKKVYMLYELEPSREVTGGAWYDDQELDEQFIQVLHDQCLLFISRGSASLEEVHAYIRESGVFRTALELDDVETVVNTLIYDGLVESFPDPARLASNRVRYKPTRLGVASNPYTCVPCSVCPVRLACVSGGQVSPEGCQYYERWLSAPPQSSAASNKPTD